VTKVASIAAGISRTVSPMQDRTHTATDAPMAWLGERSVPTCRSGS
jgi:hypothetical protein